MPDKELKCGDRVYLVGVDKRDTIYSICRIVNEMGVIKYGIAGIFSSMEFNKADLVLASEHKFLYNASQTVWYENKEYYVASRSIANVRPHGLVKIYSLISNGKNTPSTRRPNVIEKYISAEKKIRKPRASVHGKVPQITIPIKHTIKIGDGMTIEATNKIVHGRISAIHTMKDTCAISVRAINRNFSFNAEDITCVGGVLSVRKEELI